MAVWDIIGNSLDNTLPDLLNSSYTNIFGDITQQLAGGARTVNIIGADQKFLFDWEIIFEKGVDETGMMENPLFKRLFEYMMGSGGNASINIGDNNNLNLLGGKLLNAKVGHTLTVNLDDPWPLEPNPTTPAYATQYAKFKADYTVVALVNTLIVITTLICMSVAYFKYHNFTEPLGAAEDDASAEPSPSIEDTKSIILGIGLGVENRCFLYINQYLQDLGKNKAEEKLAADQQAKNDAVAATGAEIARVEALANAAKDAAGVAQATALAAESTANAAAGAAAQAAQAAAAAASANAADTALLTEQMALLEARLTLVLNTGISELQVSVGQQIAFIESVNGILAKMQDDLKYVTGLAESNNNTIQYLGSKDAKGSLDKMNPTSPSWSNLGGLLS
jgi:hypothetical protein